MKFLTFTVKIRITDIFLISSDNALYFESSIIFFLPSLWKLFQNLLDFSPKGRKNIVCYALF